MSNPHYTTDRAKRSLIEFIRGKGLSALAGIIFLLISVRMLSQADFGSYVAAIALLEIFYLATGFGLSTIAQRYVAEYRIKADEATFLTFIRAILKRRALYALAGAIIIGAIAGGAYTLGLALPVIVNLPAFYGLLVLGCLARYADEIFPALLLQGYTQALVLAAHLTRLGGLTYCFLKGVAVGLPEILAIELAANALCALAALYLLGRYLRMNAEATGEVDYRPAEMNAVARRFYIVQLLGQLWSPNTGKLIVAERLGLAVTGAYGFIQSITDMLRNYLPAYLLGNWLRPLMISRYLERRQLNEVNAMASVMFKLSLMCIVPFSMFSLAGGELFIQWASGGKVSEGATLLTAFCLLLTLQSLHVVIGMVTVTVEQPRASVVATLAACMALPLCYIGAGWAGALGVTAGLCLGEIIWIAVALATLGRQDIHVRFDIRGCMLIVLAALPTYCAMLLLLHFVPHISAPVFSIIGAVLAGLIALICFVIAKPFANAERDFLKRLLPARFCY
ncbi:lipopolysaccharide biosynthesis protein [Accumulibacter sp.]|uniref:lipopolysaccharide biosynthesis protein n=1 Tax=Accumulibacter sp. TaxID=2053492 RepID=UPI0035AE3C88